MKQVNTQHNNATVSTLFRLFLIGLIIIAIAPLAHAADRGDGALIANNAVVDVDLQRYSPNPAQPGDVVTVYLSLVNSGSEAARDVKLEIVDNYPFSVDNAQDSIRSIPIIAGDSSYTAALKVRVDKDATEGEAFLKVHISSGTSSSSIDRYLSVDLVSDDAALLISEVSQEPNPAVPGEPVTLSFKVENYADSRLRNIALTLQTKRTLGSTTTELPFAPIGQSNERRIDQLDAGASAILTFTMATDPDATSDLYKLPFTLTYADLLGNNLTKSDEIGVVVSSPTELLIYTENVDVYTDKASGSVSVKIVNSGLSQVKLLAIEFAEDESYTATGSSSKVYVGNIDSDDYESVRLNVRANGDSLNMPLVVTYRDQFNTEQTVRQTLKVNLISTEDAGQKSKGNGVIVIFVVIVLVIAFIVWQRIRRNKKKTTK